MSLQLENMKISKNMGEERVCRWGKRQGNTFKGNTCSNNQRPDQSVEPCHKNIGGK